MDWRDVPSDARIGDVFPDLTPDREIVLTSEHHYKTRKKR